jgi:protein CpxP
MKLQARKHLMSCALLAGLATAAFAQTTPTPAAPAAPAAERHHGKFDPAKRAERFNARMAELKQKLQLTAGQETAWTSFTTAMQPTGKHPRMDRDALAGMTTPDRIDHMRAMRDQRNAEMDRRAEATKAFYAQLSAEQKKTFDSETARMFQHGGRGAHRHQHG